MSIWEHIIIIDDDDDDDVDACEIKYDWMGGEGFIWIVWILALGHFSSQGNYI